MSSGSTRTAEHRLDLHGARVALHGDDHAVVAHLSAFLRHCGFADGRQSNGAPEVVVEVAPAGPLPPTDGDEVARHGRLAVRRSGAGLLIADGGSWAWLDPAAGLVRIRPCQGLERCSLDAERNLIVLYSVMSALRYRGLFGLHAACAARGDAGCLLVASSGSGKSTLVLGLLRAGWSLVADDSVVLRRRGRVEALGLRRDLYLKEERACQPVEAGHWDDVAVRQRPRRRLDTRSAYPDRLAMGCTPRLLVFPTIVDGDRSVVEPCDRVLALRELIVNSHLAELEPGMAGEHLRVLGDLSAQCGCVVLRAGRDLKDAPELAGELLGEAIARLGAPRESEGV